MKTFHQWLREMVGTYAIVGSCKGGPDYQVWGACSDLKDRPKKKPKKRKKR